MESTRVRSLATEYFEIADLEAELRKLIPPSEPLPGWEMMFHMFQTVLQRKHYKDQVDKLKVKGMAAAMAKMIPRESLRELEQRARRGDPDAQLKLGDCYMFGLKGVNPRRPDDACVLFHNAACAGNLEACVCVAYTAYLTVVGATERGKPIPLIRDARTEAIVAQMWFFLDTAVAFGHVPPLALLLGQQALDDGSWELSDVMLEALRKKDKEFSAVLAERARQVCNGCFNPGCTTKVRDVSALKACGACGRARYCSRACQAAHWRLAHKNECRRDMEKRGPQESTWRNEMGSTTTSVVEVEDSLGKMQITSSSLSAVFLKEMVRNRQQPMVDQHGFPRLQEQRTVDQHGMENLLGRCRVDEHEQILVSVRNGQSGHALPLNEMIDQAKRLMSRGEYGMANRCLTRALDAVYTQSPIYGGLNPDERGVLLQLVSLRASCNLQLAKLHLMKRNFDLVMEDVDFALHTGVFILSDFSPECLQQLRNIEAEAKALELRIQPEAGRRPRQQRGRKKKHKKKSTPPQQPSLSVVQCQQVVASNLALNATIDDDGCPICFNLWTQFDATSFAVVLPCQHALCAPCLSRYHQGCKESFETDTGEEAKTLFYCVICRKKISPKATEILAHSIVERKLCDAFDLLAPNLGLDVQETNKLLVSLLLQNHFDVPRVAEVLFNLVGLVSHDWTKDLDYDKKQKLYESARAPVRALEEKWKQLRAAVSSTYETDSAHWAAQMQELETLSTQVQEARVNAARDIFERMNAAGLMGVCNPAKRGDTCIDLHGLHATEAKEMVKQFVVPVLPVLKSVVLITGRGLHSSGGVGVLKSAMQSYLAELGIVCQEIHGNAGAIRAVQL